MENASSTTTQAGGTTSSRLRPVIKSPSNLLVGFDFSPHSERALQYAVGLVASKPSAVVHVLWSMDSEAIGAYDSKEDALHFGQRRLVAYLTDMFRTLEEEGCPLEGLSAVTHVTTDLPDKALTDLAFIEGADLVVVGTRDNTGLKKFVLGSVAEQVMKHARCPVMICRESAGAAVPAIEPSPPPGTGSTLGKRHTYRYVGRNAAARENMPLLIPQRQ